MNQIAISTQGLCKSYGNGLSILKDISIDIREGESVALIGPNGAGKSTLLKSLIGLHDICEGSVTVLGQAFTKRPVNGQRAAIRRNVGFVFQAHSLVRQLSVLTNVIHGKFGHPGAWRAFHQAIAPAEWREEAVRSLEAVKLVDKAYCRSDELSGGQQQRVAIARALVRRPRLFIADEPAASLDPAAGHDVMQQLVELSRATGSTLVFTSHDMEHALTYADRVIALKAGSIHIDAPSRDLSMDDLEGVFRA